MKSLFRSSNKSQASFDKHPESRDESPIQPDPAYSQTQAFGGAQLPSQQLQQHQDQADERYYTENSPQSPSAHILGRSPSTRIAPSVGEVFAQDQRQPTVNVVPPANPVVVIPPQHHVGPAAFAQSQRGDREQKKSKRSYFGLGSSHKKEDKDNAGDHKGVGRSPSILRKNSQQPYPPSPKSPRDVNNTQFTVPNSKVSNPHAQELLNEGPVTDSDKYERYYRPQSQYDSGSPQPQHQTVRYVESTSSFEEPPSVPRHKQQPSIQSQRAAYQVYHQPESASSSTNYLPQPQQQAQDNNLPPFTSSQASLGPPSPLAVHQSDSRPPTAGTQTRHSIPVENQPPPQEKVHQRQISQDQQEHLENMGRNDPPNGNVRQQREDDRHNVFQSQQDPRIRTQGQEQGRSTPPPGRTREDVSNLDYHQLLQKHEDLLAKYSKVKRYYFERDAQVTQLQNTVATQRLSMSKTSLDDAQYTTRFERLNGAIQNLSFNIRKDWRRIPNWLAPVCNRDAHQVGTKEMTAVGRACLTRWLYERLFCQVFHPGIEPNLSYHLKAIERNLRTSSYGIIFTNEQQEDLMTKITTWRLTTIEGLSGIINSRDAEVYTDNLTNLLTKQLNDHIRFYLADPPPPGLADNLYTIVGQAIGIASNIPLESRDVCIEYFMPASHINETYMRLEAGMTPLQAPGSAPSQHDFTTDDTEDLSSSMHTDSQAQSQADLETQIREAQAKGTSPNPSAGRSDLIGANIKAQQQQSAGQSLSISQQTTTRDSKKSSLFGGFVNKKPAAAPHPPPHNSNFNIQSTKFESASDISKNDASVGSGEYNIQTLCNGTTENKIRFAVFLAVEVKGRGVMGGNGTKEGSIKEGTGNGSEKGTDNTGPGGQTTGAGEEKSKAAVTNVNVLVKAPVYCFDSA